MKSKHLASWRDQNLTKSGRHRYPSLLPRRKSVNRAVNPNVPSRIEWRDNKRFVVIDGRFHEWKKDMLDVAIRYDWDYNEYYLVVPTMWMGHSGNMWGLRYEGFSTIVETAFALDRKGRWEHGSHYTKDDELQEMFSGIIMEKFNVKSRFIQRVSRKYHEIRKLNTENTV